MKNEKKPEEFDENDPKDIRFENELLKLKIRAEFGGAHFSSESLPPEIENFFLKNVIKLEHAFANRETISLFEKIGRPKTFCQDQLNDDAIKREQIALEDLMRRKGVFLTFPENHTYRNKYTFITEKLFKVQVDNLDMPEIMMHFNCDDFDDDFEDY